MRQTSSLARIFLKEGLEVFPGFAGGELTAQNQLPLPADGASPAISAAAGCRPIGLDATALEIVYGARIRRCGDRDAGG